MRRRSKRRNSPAADSWDFRGKYIRTLVNGEGRQDGNTDEVRWDMHYLVADIATRLYLWHRRDFAQLDFACLGDAYQERECRSGSRRSRESLAAQRVIRPGKQSRDAGSGVPAEDWALPESDDPDHQHMIRRSIDDGELAF
jgi:hypothetical protein